MEKIDLPGGAWAQLRDPDLVTERQRKPYLEQMGRVARLTSNGRTLEETGISDLVDVQNALVLALVDSWSYEAPVSADGMLDLPGRAMDALRLACQPFQTRLMPDFGPTPDPDSPSSPSNA